MQDPRLRESDACMAMITKAQNYHSLSEEEKLKHWKKAKRPSRWPQFLAALSYAEKLIEVYDFEACDWLVLTEKPGHVFGSAMCYMQGQLIFLAIIFNKLGSCTVISECF